MAGLLRRPSLDPHLAGAGRAGVAVTALVLALAALVGFGAVGTFALWRDSEHGTITARTGVVVFGAQRLASAATGDTADAATTYATSTTAVTGRTGVNQGSVSVTFGQLPQTTALYGSTDPAVTTGGAVAIPFRVDSLVQGHRRLAFQVSRSITGQIFGNASTTVRLYAVASAGTTDCNTSTTGTDVLSTQTFTPWPTDYPTLTSTPTSAYFCLVARFVPTVWNHSDTATVTATGPGTSGTVTGTSNTWSAMARQTLTPAAETNTLTFTFRTYRPGATPW
jgi:hypothetical protein